MADKLKKILGYAWAAPVTLFGLLYVLPIQAAGWYKWTGKKDDALVWQVSVNSPAWLKSLWKSWAGHAIGNVVVMNKNIDEAKVHLDHEMVHVRQCMRLGIFQPVIYAVSWVGIYFGCEASHPYWSNPFEIDARRAVGQPIDIEGGIKRLREKKVESQK